MSSTRSSVARTLMWVGIACAATSLATTRVGAEALLVIEAENGRVLYAQNAGQPWYPASVTKLMTAYVTLRAVKDGRLALDTPLTVSPNAVAQSPVKMGFGVGTVVTVDNALKMLMVKSANDMAVVLAEGVAGSIENFADEMNANARRLGMINRASSIRMACPPTTRFPPRATSPSWRAPSSANCRNTITTGTFPASVWARWCGGITTP